MAMPAIEEMRSCGLAPTGMERRSGWSREVAARRLPQHAVCSTEALRHQRARRASVQGRAAQRHDLGERAHLGVRGPPFPPNKKNRLGPEPAEPQQSLAPGQPPR